MEQKDFILREIEKISQIFSFIKQKLFSSKIDSEIISENEINEILLNELNFDFEKFLQLDYESSNDYLNCFDGFSIENIENLAELFLQIGATNSTEQSKKYIEKSLQLYQLVIFKSKTYSFEREVKIQNIKDALQHWPG